MGCAPNALLFERWNSHTLTTAHRQPGVLSVVLGRRPPPPWPFMSLAFSLTTGPEANCLSLRQSPPLQAELPSCFPHC